jgi:hypothetical protein
VGIGTGAVDAVLESGDELFCCDAPKAWNYEHESRPGVSVIGARLQELTSLR